MGEAAAARATDELREVGPALWELPATWRDGMRVPIRVFGSQKLVREMDAQVFEQAAHVAMLPGIVEASFCMPDAHWGYGFPIGGVAAVDPRHGVISPGGIGFDINCGMRLLRSDLTWPEVEPVLRRLVDRLAERIPAGVGSEGFVRLSAEDFEDVLKHGARWAVDRGFGSEADLDFTEARGQFPGALPGCVSARAVERGKRQLGTLGSGNHYLEIQVLRLEGTFEAKLASAFGLDIPEQVVVMFHCGSRGLGHQVATDHLQLFLRKMKPKFGLQVIDRELACAPFSSDEGQAYYGAMCAAANMSFANRQVIQHRVMEVFGEVLGRSPEALGLRNVYDVSHNTAKLETHRIHGRARELLVHRKGATRALPPGHPDLPPAYRETGQPVIIGGSMETGSYVLAGAEGAHASFCSSAHGSGRTMSRRRARRLVHGRELQDRMAARGIWVRAATLSGLAEEAGIAYKDVDEVAEATERAGLSRRVAHLVPVGNVKG